MAAEGSGMTCVVADDHPAILDSVARLLQANGIAIVATCRSAESALEKLEELRPDIALVDVYMPVMGGIELARRAGRAVPETSVLLYTGSPDRSLVLESLDAGARGVILKEAPLEELLRAIEMASAGRTYIDPVLGAADATAQEPVLTARERDVLRLLADGIGNEEIGKRLFISAETVRGHVSKAMAKLGAQKRTQAVATALRRSLIK